MKTALHIAPLVLGLSLPAMAAAVTINVNGEEVDASVTFTNGGLKINASGITVGDGETKPPPVEDSDGDNVNDDSDECPNTPAGVEVDQDGCAIKDPDPEEPGGNAEIPSGAKGVGTIDLDNPPARDRKGLGSKTHVYTLKAPGSSARYGNFKNNYTSKSPETRRMWVSASPAGAPLSKTCDMTGYESATMWWTAGSTYQYFACNLTAGETYYLNVELKSGSYSQYYLTVNRY